MNSWCLPEVARGRAELDQLDVVEGLPLRGYGPVEVLNAISLWGKLALAVRRLGRLVRFCLTEGVVPVFAPPRETGFQAAIESCNGLWRSCLAPPRSCASTPA